jgi:hypothetical protein
MQHKESAMSRWTAFILFIAVAVWSELPAQVQDEGSNYYPPFAVLARYDFTEGEFFKPLGAVAGTWVASGGTFNSTSATPALATIDSYIPQNVFFDDLPEINANPFFYRAGMLNQSSGSSTRVGIVYQYQDAANFYEASFSPTGSVFVREVANGLSRTVATGTYCGGGQNKWFDVEVAWTAAETIVLVNDVPVVRGIKQDRLTHGRVGLITRQTTAKFDRLLVTREYGDPQFRESFNGAAPTWTVAKGTWSVVNGVYQSSAVQHGSITLLPIHIGVDNSTETRPFEVSARMLNPYGGSGNRMGFVYTYQGGSYEEIVFGADGIARINHVNTWIGPDGKTNVSVIPRETAPYPWARNHWFNVSFAGHASIDGIDKIDEVSVNGTPIFTNLESGDLRGPIGLVTNWTPGRFDDVWFHHGGFSRTETFDRYDPTKPPYWFAARGTWDAEGAVLNNRTAGANDIVYTSWQGSTDYTVSARMLNPYRASGNRIGLIFGFDVATKDYYEVVFAPTGQAALNKFIQGQLTQVATATHSALGTNVWFNVELARRGPNATVKVNNQTVFANVPAAELDNSIKRGRVGVIAHWSPGRFDDLQFEDFVP